MAEHAAMLCVPDEKNRKAKGKTKCLLCFKPYYTPKILECFHTFCVICLHVLETIWTPLLRGSTQQCGIPCPVCQKPSRVPEGGAHEFCDNDYVYGISEEEFETMHITTGSRSSQLIYCLVCAHKTYVQWACEECQLLLCSHCKHFHDTFQGSKDHNVHKIADFDETELKTPRQAGGACNSQQSLESMPDQFEVSNESMFRTLDDSEYEDLESAGVLPESLHSTRPPPLPPRRYKATFDRTLSSPAMPVAANYPCSKTPLDTVNENDSACSFGSVSAMSQMSLSPDEGTYYVRRSGLRQSMPPANRKKDRSEHFLLTTRLQTSMKLLPPARKWPLPWPEANVQIISFSSDLVFLIGTAAQKRKKLAVFDLEGRKLISKTPMPDIETMAVLEFTKIQLLFGKENQALYWTTFQHQVPQELVTVSHLALDSMILSKTVPGRPAYVVGINQGHQCQIQTVHLERSTPPYPLDIMGNIQAFDVSLDGTYFALLRKQKDVTVDVYQKQGKTCKFVAGYSFEDRKGMGDVCFYVPKAGEREIGEVLVVADFNRNQLLLLDYKGGCNILDTVHVSSPASLAKGPKGALWVNCKLPDGKSEILCYDGDRSRATPGSSA